MSDRISLLGVNEAREEHWIADEEDGCVVSNLKHSILLGVSLFKVKYD